MKELIDSRNKVVLHSLFTTIDGEANGHGGAGHWSTFVRLQGCPVGCVWCDTVETWAWGGGEVITVKELVDRISVMPYTSRVTITGGEPLLQAEAVVPLVWELAAGRNKLVSVETSGCVDFVSFLEAAQNLRLQEYISVVADYKVDPQSWKAYAYPRRPDEDFAKLSVTDVIKFVVRTAEEVELALEIIADNQFSARCVISPINGRHGGVSAEEVYWKLRYNQFAVERDVGLNVQLHKVVLACAKDEEWGKIG